MGQGLTGVRLSLTATGDKSAAGTFEFYPATSTGTAGDGSFAVTASISRPGQVESAAAVALPPLGAGVVIRDRVNGPRTEKKPLQIDDLQGLCGSGGASGMHDQHL